MSSIFNQARSPSLRASYYISCCLLLSLFCAQASQAQTWAAAYFRGVPNAWGATAMTYNASTALWETTQTFTGTNPGFKISRNAADWVEAYPAVNYVVSTGDGDYKITFNDATKAIAATKITSTTISANSICYNNVSNFAVPYIYFWAPVPNTRVTPMPAWPGKTMTQRGSYYCYDFTSLLVGGGMPTSMSIIFSNNGASQTANLTYTAGNGCYDNGVWKTLQQCGFTTSGSSSSAVGSSSSSKSSSLSSSSKSSSAAATSSSSSSKSSSSVAISSSSSSKSSSSLAISSSSSKSSSSIAVSSSSSKSSSSAVASSTASSTAPTKTIIYFKNTANYATPYMHYFTTAPARADSAWPGVVMTSLNGVVNGGWYSYEFSTPLLTSSGIVFSNNGTPQTADLTFTAPNNCWNGTAWQTAAACGVLNTSSSSSSSSAVASSSHSITSSNSSRSSISSSSSSAGAADDFRARTVYFMFVDRFFNGNTNNDNGNNAATTSTVKGAGNTGEWRKYWGGDIAGIIAKLDYLQALGVTSIWVTPLVDNVDAGTADGGYHGYWSHDFYEVDEHLGDWALVDELHVQMQARGMKLILDIAPNHSNPNNEIESGRLLKEGAFITDFASGKGIWYHDNGQISDCNDTDPNTTCGAEWDDPWSFRNKSLYNLSDFNHGTNNTNSVADTYLINAALKWMDHGVDGFRIDAIKHIEPGFINRFSAAMRAKKPDVYIFGEWWDAGANNGMSMTFLNENRGSELLDFNMRDNLENAIAGNETMIDLSNYIKSRPAAMNNKEDLQPIFLDNHDVTRTSVYLQTSGNTSHGNGKGMTKALADARQNLGMALVMTLPGVPIIYYGTEQNTANFSSSSDFKVGADPYNREQMPSFNQTTPAFSMLNALSSLRKSSLAIQRGTYTERWSTADILVFQRQEGSDCAVIAVNRGAQATITVPSLCLANGAYTSKVGSDIVNISTGSGTFTLSPNEIVVLH